MRRSKLIIPCALAGLALSAGAAQAGEVIVVDGDRATRVNDPAVPSRAEIAMRAPRGRGPVLAARRPARPRR